MGTLLLGASNCMIQCLSAPARTEAVSAQMQGRYLDFGLRGGRNLAKWGNRTLFSLLQPPLHWACSLQPPNPRTAENMTPQSPSPYSPSHTLLVSPPKIFTSNSIPLSLVAVANIKQAIVCCLYLVYNTIYTSIVSADKRRCFTTS
jgi:hypothetical protein